MQISRNPKILAMFKWVELPSVEFWETSKILNDIKEPSNMSSKEPLDHVIGISIIVPQTVLSEN